MEPLVQFVVIGAVLACAWSFWAPDGASQAITISQAAQAQSLRELQQRLGRTATDDERTAAIQRLADDEMLVRAALRLGLDREDTIVRRRLIQKMECLGQWQSVAAEPDPELLRTYYAQHATRYSSPERYSLGHVFWSRDVHGDARARQLAQRHRDQSSPDPLAGDPFVHGRSWQALSRDQLAARMGPQFAEALSAAQIGAWQGPLPSAYGWHNLVVQARHAPGLRPYDEVADQVLADWLQQERDQARASLLRDLRGRYTVRVEP